MKTFLKHIMLVLLCFGLASCASTEEEKEAKAADYRNLVAPNIKPEKIYIQSFETDFSKLYADVKNQELDSFKKTATEMTSTAIVDKLLKRLIPAQVLGPNDPAPTGNYWLIKGRLINLTKDNRSLKAFMNWGDGGTPTDAMVWVHNSNKSNVLPFMEFATTQAPAPVITVTGMIPVMTEDANRLGEVIAARIAEAVEKLPVVVAQSTAVKAQSNTVKEQSSTVKVKSSTVKKKTSTAKSLSKSVNKK